MDSFFIQRSSKYDCKEIMNLIHELAVYEKMPDGPKINVKTFEEDGFGEKSFYKCFVAVNTVDLIIIGYVLYFFTYSIKEGKCIYMEDLYVTPKHRKLGIGKKLWQSVVKEGITQNAVNTNFSVLGWNEPSIKFYEKNGATNLTQNKKTHLLRFDRDAMNSFQ